MTTFTLHSKYSKSRLGKPYTFKADRDYRITPNAAKDGWDIAQYKKDHTVEVDFIGRSFSDEEVKAFHSQRNALLGIVPADLNDFPHLSGDIPEARGEITPACPHCESTNVSAMGNGDYSCDSCDTHIDAFTW
jgi:hypothetical protein